MRMKDYRLTPCVECSDDAGRSPDVLWIKKEFVECIPYASKEKIGHDPYIQEPNFIEFMRQGKNHVVMTAREKSFFLSFQPFFYPNPIALRTKAMLA